ncbi:MAG: tRNA (adenosine(37)-N6)-threonylcarbamoyltransferase complex transferase subunit TsaD [Deltaproteobacteria bacterium]|jgi:N6-L-threonylcarbamoyladenine synthase|nr:tRNA (adenosine(37)-N6)-threonylcarbamoyltransferase complex transferase subunit TsaD [Deltaproteobacteria bacterium]
MPVLALESSCDETACALVENNLVLSELVRSQADLHRKYGGVVPEIASRAHLEAVDLITGAVLEKAGKTLADVSGIAVTLGPGLLGALLVAVSFAKGLSMATGLPLTGVNHVKAHALAPFLKTPDPDPEARARDSGRGEPKFPLAALVASGGHTSLFLMEDFLTFKTLGRTLDDAAGEAFDKSAKLMGFGYPGGKVVEDLARGGDPNAYKITRPMLREGLDFSFSGLKTRVMTLYREHDMESGPSDSREIRDLAASFQAAAAEVMVTKLLSAAKSTGAKGAVLAGGVAANGELRRMAREALEPQGIPLFVPKPSWCADNAAMIGFLGSLQLEKGQNLLGRDSEPKTRWNAEDLP